MTQLCLRSRRHPAVGLVNKKRSPGYDACHFDDLLINVGRLVNHCWTMFGKMLDDCCMIFATESLDRDAVVSPESAASGRRPGK